jgi:cytochrome b6-f complex iron-sulfur subunit
MAEKMDKKISRRDFLSFAWVGTLVGFLGQTSWALFEFLKPRVEPGSFGTKVNAGKGAEFKPGTVSHIQEGRFYISRLEDGKLLALWHRCTHLGCTVPWREDEGRFHCPCHSSIFDPKGEVVSGPAPRPLDLFPVEIVDGEVIVDTGRSISREQYDPSQAVDV